MKSALISIRTMAEKIGKLLDLEEKETKVSYLDCKKGESQIVISNVLRELVLENLTEGSKLSFQPDNGSGDWLLYIDPEKPELYSFMGALATTLSKLESRTRTETQRQVWIKELDKILQETLGKVRFPTGIKIKALVEYSAGREEYVINLSVNDCNMQLHNPDPQMLKDMLLYKELAHKAFRGLAATVLNLQKKK